MSVPVAGLVTDADISGNGCNAKRFLTFLVAAGGDGHGDGHVTAAFARYGHAGREGSLSGTPLRPRPVPDIA
eukprot:92419-Rhodomonas_salina.1